ncbi:MAG TPA: hypothetical protein VFU86_02265 [Terriglobales bacterium]|nr:hypothetical protein [Terriglobales bacterium]
MACNVAALLLIYALHHVSVGPRVVSVTAATRFSSFMPPEGGKTVESIISAPDLWGKDFPSVLQSLPAFSRSGERRVSVFPERIVGSTKAQNRDQAETRLARLADQFKATAKLTPTTPKMQQYLIKERIPLKIEVFQDNEDRTFRTSAEAPPSAQFLRRDLTIAQVRKELGKEQKVTTEVLDDGTERRPVVLTLHHYAGGAIVFVESDINPHIGSVDRVILDAAAISAALFKEGK